MQNFVVKAHIFPLKNVKSILKDKVPSNNSSSISWKSFDFFPFSFNFNRVLINFILTLYLHHKR